MSSLSFRFIACGKETVRGSLVAADKLLRGKCVITPHLELHTPEEENNSLNPALTSTIVGQYTPIKFDATANFEQLVDLLGMTVIPGTITTPGGGTTSRNHQFLPVLTALSVQDTYTFEVGNSAQEYECGFVIGESLVLTCEMNAPWMAAWTGFGGALAKSTRTGSLTAPVLEPIVANKTKVYVDTTWAGLGGTQVTGALCSATVTIPSGLQRVWTADGGLAYTTVSEGARRPTIECKFVHNAAGVAQYDLWAAQSLRFIRLEVLGSLIEGAIYKELNIDMAVRWDAEVQMQQDHMGMDALVLSGTCYHDPTSDKDLEVNVVNTVTGT